MKKFANYFLHPQKIIIYFMNIGFFKFLPDEFYLKIKYRLVMGETLNIKKPKTFNEKMQVLKLKQREPKYTNLVDKISVRKFIKEKIGSKYLVPIIGTYERYDEINFATLPNQFVLKPNNTSGDVFICLDKSTIDYEKLRKKVNKWLNRKYYYLHREWPYKNIKPCLIIEKYLGTNINDYKFMCFDGKVKCSFVCSDRSSNKGLHVTFFDRNWNKMPFTRHYPSADNILKPNNYEKMIHLSEILSNGLKFVRVDFYEIDNKIYFGELTFYPGSGYEEFEPKIYDYIIGEWIDL